MKKYFKHFLIPYLIFGAIVAFFITMMVINNMSTEQGMKFSVNIYAVILATVVTTIFWFCTRNTKAKKTISGKTFLGYQQMNDTRDVLIRKSLVSKIISK